MAEEEKKKEDPVVEQNRALLAENDIIKGRNNLLEMEVRAIRDRAAKKPKRELDKNAKDRFDRPYDGR